METENGTKATGGSLLRLGAAACAGEKPGGGEEQPYDANGRHLGTLYAANGHVGGGRLPHDAPGPRQSPLGRWPKRGARVDKYYILPQKIVGQNRHVALVYYQKKGTLMDMEDRIVGKGYSDAPGHVNAPDDERLEGQGVIPRGTWIVGPVIEKESRYRPQGREPHQARAGQDHGRARARHGSRPLFVLHSCGFGQKSWKSLRGLHHHAGKRRPQGHP